MTRTTHMRALPRQPRERGVVLFIALIAMVAMAFSGAALMRSIETTTAVTGNLGFHQTAAMAPDAAIATAIAALFERNLIVDPTRDDPVQGYFASRQANEDVRGIPYALQKISNFPLDAPVGNPSDGTAVRYVIERMCSQVGPPSGDYCTLALVNNAQPSGASGSPADTPRVPLYRQTIRVDGPSGTMLIAQAFIADIATGRRVSRRVMAE
jgi:type IV pilus assembly protein PilX